MQANLPLSPYVAACAQVKLRNNMPNLQQFANFEIDLCTGQPVRPDPSCVEGLTNRLARSQTSLRTT